MINGGIILLTFFFRHALFSGETFDERDLSIALEHRVAAKPFVKSRTSFIPAYVKDQC